MCKSFFYSPALNFLIAPFFQRIGRVRLRRYGLGLLGVPRRRVPTADGRLVVLNDGVRSSFSSQLEVPEDVQSSTPRVQRQRYLQIIPLKKHHKISVVIFDQVISRGYEGTG